MEDKVCCVHKDVFLRIQNTFVKFNVVSKDTATLCDHCPSLCFLCLWLQQSITLKETLAGSRRKWYWTTEVSSCCLRKNHPWRSSFHQKSQVRVSDFYMQTESQVSMGTDGNSHSEWPVGHLLFTQVRMSHLAKKVYRSWLPPFMFFNIALWWHVLHFACVFLNLCGRFAKFSVLSLNRFLRCSPFDEYKVWKRQVDNKSGTHNAFVGQWFVSENQKSDKTSVAGALCSSTEKGTQRLNTLVKSLLLRRTKDEKSKTTGQALVRSFVLAHSSAPTFLLTSQKIQYWTRTCF